MNKKTIALLFLIVLTIIGCNEPAAKTPVLRAVLKQTWPTPPGTNLPVPVIVPQTASLGRYSALPAKRLIIQFTGPQVPSGFEVTVNGIKTKNVSINDIASQQAEEDWTTGNGWWDIRLNNAGSDTFYEAIIAIPRRYCVYSDSAIPIEIRNISNNSSAQGTDKISDPLKIIINPRPAPTSAGWMCAPRCGSAGLPPCCETPSGCPKPCY